MLSQEDQRRLHAIERQLEVDDPELAKLLTRWPEPARADRTAFAAVATVILGTLGVLVGMLLLAPMLVLFSAALTFAGWTWVFGRERAARRRRR